MRVNGLYGHVRSNDVRSITLFAGFVLAFHLLAVLGLLVPLAMFDPEHAPFYGWAGYVARWVPIVTVTGAVLFAVQMAWHVRVVRRRTDFRFVDDQDEPRLCRIVEPLVIAAGLPTPYVGVIDSPALNAFACGIRRKDAVLVFTRGLIDSLDDDELAAVAAHEIVHILNGDIRLIAATNVCLDTLMLLQQREMPRANRIYQGLMMPVLALALPLLLVLILVVSFLRQLAIDASRLTRLLIASAREFIADAEAVRLTQNPAALVSALRRIDGCSAIPGLGAGQDAMMIDGAHEGALATHPTIADRIAAIVAVTGSMALIAPARRDTRPAALRAGVGFGRRLDRPATPSRLPKSGAATALARVSGGDGFNRLGLTREMSVGAVAAIALFAWAHRADLGTPSAMAAALDPAPMRTMFAMGGKGFGCQLRGTGALVGLSEKPMDCGAEEIDGMLASHRGAGGLLGTMADNAAAAPGKGLHYAPDGTFSNMPPAAMQLAEVKERRCFQTSRYSVGDRGLHSVGERPRQGAPFSLPRWLGGAKAAAESAVSATPGQRDAALRDYFERRKTLGETIHRFFGEPGLQLAAESYAGEAHQNAAALLRQRLSDPRFAAKFKPLEQAEMALLAEAPAEFISCVARRTRAA